MSDKIDSICHTVRDVKNLCFIFHFSKLLWKELSSQLDSNLSSLKFFIKVTILMLWRRDLTIFYLKIKFFGNTTIKQVSYNQEAENKTYSVHIIKSNFIQ